jgi:hypothetical protein
VVEARTWRHSPVCSQAVDHLWSPLHAIGFFLHVVAEFVSRERHSRESKVQLQALDTAMLFGYVAQSTRSASGPSIHLCCTSSGKKLGKRWAQPVAFSSFVP